MSRPFLPSSCYNDSMLNPQQKKAVELNKGPVLIVAGAGTGKTTVIVEKIKHLILKKKVRPEKILALTFTEKAAAEMEERVDQSLPYGMFQMWISTFHSFADQILRAHIGHIGIDPGYKLMGDAETVSFLKKNLFLFELEYFRPIGNPNKFLHSLIQHFDRLRDENISPNEYLQYAEKQNLKSDLTEEEKKKTLELARAYKKFQDLKVKNSKLDFADLIYHLLELLHKRPNILAQLKEQFEYILVDEFQDTNIAQYLLIKLLAPPSNKVKLTVVGDDSQAIYKFRGASVSNILQFMKDYSEAESVTLNKNYRSNQVLLDYAYRLIKNNDPDTLESQLGISKELKGTKKGDKDTSLQLYIGSNSDNEADYIVRSILEQTKADKDLKYSDIAILVRANKHAEPVIASLNRAGIPYRIWGKSALYKQPEIRDLIAYLKTLRDPYDSASFYRILTMSLIDIDHHDISLLTGFAKKTSLSLTVAMEVYASLFNNEWYLPQYDVYRPHIPLFSESTKSKLTKLTAMLRRHQNLIKTHTAGQILYYFLEDIGYLKKMASSRTDFEEKSVINISHFFNKLKSLEGEQEDSSVSAVVDYLETSLEIGESPNMLEADKNSYNAVNILTVHAAKGLEFRVVYILNLVHGRFPTYNKRESIPIPDELIKEILPQGDFHTLEERRLFYVALTRAKEKLFLTGARFYGDGKRQRKISPFVIETVGQEKITQVTSEYKDTNNQLTIFDFKPQELKPQQSAKDDKNEIKVINNLSNFSYSQLESFSVCALQYKYLYVLKIPTTPSAAASFGESIHKTLQRFYMDFQKNNTVDLEYLHKLYKRLWIPVGYESAADEAYRKKKGEEMLTGFYKSFHDKHKSIIGVEKLFKIKIDTDIYITGKIDRIDQAAEDGIEIIDYKTGRMPDEKELKKNLQLSIYALAATDPSMFGKKIDDVHLTFYYLNDNKKITSKRSQEDLMEVKQEIRKRANEIKVSHFKANPGPWCKFCQFNLICDAGSNYLSK